ncbi:MULTISPECIES: MSMEG_1061 family FMN-dependent PPOX-type flavoprotein [Cohnella]|uniref:MSMEG_1061 family FMN-dependent PPOX-type flavoprotein n=1 Tax=Cohnella TaxID=329857 RepID=UPI001F077BF4|nr:MULTISPECIES: MSMEG_1061 family FMN-dependent PPOX-type flavoprotein [Cohnella]
MSATPAWMNDTIATAEQIRERIEAPHEAIVKKTVSVIEDHVENYLKLSPLFFLATSNGSRRADVTPRGDKPGFVKVLDERHLAFPDRPGNRRTDSLLNIIENPQVGMIFLIPGFDEVLRINGRAVITRNEAFIESQQWTGKTTGMAVVVETEEIFIHCPRAFKQSGVWKAEQWISKEDHPSAIDMYHAHLRMNGYEF